MSKTSSAETNEIALSPASMAALALVPTADVAPRNIPKRGIPQYLNENVPADYKATLAKITELEDKLETERSYKQYLEALAAAASINLEAR